MRRASRGDGRRRVRGGSGSEAVGDDAGVVRVKLGGVDAAVRYAGLMSSSLKAIQVVIPGGTWGRLAVVAEVGGVSTQAGVTITEEP
jgi:uncharacterized protein (TIGR03437 family)